MMETTTKLVLSGIILLIPVGALLVAFGDSDFAPAWLQWVILALFFGLTAATAGGLIVGALLWVWSL